jgi:bifunctional non-homologous end joining protein LigD
VASEIGFMVRSNNKSLKLKPPCEGAKPADAPSVIHPMLATLVDKPFSNPDWLFETKWDGIRAVCFLTNGQARFVSRNQNDVSAQYPELANIGDCINGRVAVLDGEIVALDEQGISRFQLLQPRMGRKNAAEIAGLTGKTRVAYYIFDLLYLDGFDLTPCPLVARKTKLQSLIKSGKNVRYSDHILEHGEELYREIARIPLEGMIAKRRDSSYAQRRTHDWLKIKTVLESEVVIAGYTEPRSSRSYFGALVVGLYDGQTLRYVGHTGGGFNEKWLAQIYQMLQPLKTKASPFAEQVQTNEPVQWVKPKLVAQVRFTEWTADRRLRQPIFLGLREDKKARECKFEVARDVDEME